MSNNKKMQGTENTNEWINWIEEAIAKEHLNYYEYKQFSNIQEIGTGDFGKVYRANWKDSRKQFTLKSFFNLNNVTMKEIVCEIIYYLIHVFFRIFFFFYWPIFLIFELI
jgi:hypothetical protein